MMFIFSKILRPRTFSKCISWFDFLNNTITRRLHEAEIITRPVKSNGLWCCTLLPTILITYNLFYEVPDVFKVVSHVSLGLLIYSLLFINFVSISSVVVKKPMYGGCVTCGLVSSLFICIFMSEVLVPLLILILGWIKILVLFKMYIIDLQIHPCGGILLSLVYSVPAMWAYNMLLRYTLKAMPRAFTLGEAMVVTQAIVLSLLAILIDVLWIRRKNPIDIVVYSVLSTVGLIVTALYYLKCDYRTWRTFTVLGGVGAMYMMIVLLCILGYDVIFHLVSSLFTDYLRRWLIAVWAILVVGAVVLVWLRTHAALKADTATRKTFHILATLVFLSGILLDSELMWLAAGVAFGLLILIETLRKFDVKPFSTFLERAFNVYCDEKEVGGWALPPLYLLTGLASPLVLVPVSASDLERLAGVLTIGVGDSAASFIGSRYGRSTWRGTSKTVGGMLANLISQLFVICLLYMYGVCGCAVAWRGALAAAAAAFVEASTDQVDNLILPLVSIIAFQFTNFVNILT